MTHGPWYNFSNVSNKVNYWYIQDSRGEMFTPLVVGKVDYK